MKYLMLTAIVLGLIACKDDGDDSIYKILEFSMCKSTTTDSLEIAEQVVGNWKWAEQYCPCCVGAKPTVANKQVVVLFTSDGTYTVVEDNVTISSGEWELTPHLDSYSILTSNTVFMSYLFGSVTICGNQMLADWTPLDGCQNLFIKTD